MARVKVGDTIRIINMDDVRANDYNGKEGIVQHIDSIGQLHGTWGGLAVVPECDTFVVIKTK